jgi:hypothetical protein
MCSFDIQSSASRREIETLTPQGLTWTSDTTVAANDPPHSALQMCVNVDTSSVPSGLPHNIGLSGDFDSLLRPSNAMYASDFTKQNDVRTLNVNKFPHDFSLRGRTLPGGSYISDFATSMFRVLPHVFPRAVSSAHLVILGNSSVLDSAIENVSDPSTLQLVRQQSIDYQIIYMIFHRLINDIDAASALIEPKTELDQLFVQGLKHCFSLEKRVFSSLVSSVQSPYNLALVENMFRAALVLGNGQAISAVLEMNQTSLLNRALTLSGEKYLPLEYAASHGLIQAMQTLLDHGADLDQQGCGINIMNMTLGHRLAPPVLEVLFEVLRLLLDHGLELDPAQSVQSMMDCSRDVLSLLITHCLSKSFETFFKHEGLPRLLLREDEDDLSSEMLEAILHQAFLHMDGQQKMWNWILSRSLSAAILRRRGSAVNILLSMGATPDIHCLISAAQSDDVQIFEEFLSRGLDPITRISYGIFENVRDRFLSPPPPPLPPPESLDRYFYRKIDCTAISESV